MSSGLPYFAAIRALLDDAERKNAATIATCAPLIADSLAAGGLLHAFGTGHSHMMAEELYHRAGGLIPVNAMMDSRTMLHEGANSATFAERLTGYAEVVLARYTLRAGEVMIVASNSGRNATSVEMALAAQARGLPVIALTSVAHSQSQASRHASGKRLFEVADHVLDNCAPVGDALLPLSGAVGNVSAVSTVTGAVLLQALVYAVCEQLAARGIAPPIFLSSNVGGSEADAHNDALLEAYRARLPHL
jgi:uncharacterized phosphosugar-binding protein